MSFLWNQYVMLIPLALFFGSLFWAYIQIGVYARAGEPISSQQRFWIRITIVTTVLSLIGMWLGYSQFVAIASAVYGMGIAVGAGALIATTIFLISFRKAKMERAYQKYDELRAAGKKPCLVLSSIFGPKVIERYPPLMKTGMLMWVENGTMRFYATTTQQRFNSALGD